MKIHTRFWFLLALSGFFVVLDQILKFIAHTNPFFSWYIFKPWIGWELLKNTGIAFSLPINNTLVIFVTPLILLGLAVLLLKTFHKQPNCAGAYVLIIGGAVSNYIDRVLFGFTIDYIRLFTGVINIGDIMIIIGAILLILYEKKEVKK